MLNRAAVTDLAMLCVNNNEPRAQQHAGMVACMCLLVQNASGYAKIRFVSKYDPLVVDCARPWHGFQIENLRAV